MSWFRLARWFGLAALADRRLPNVLTVELNQSSSPVASGRSGTVKVAHAGCDGDEMSSESGPSPRSPSAWTTPIRALTGPFGGGVMPPTVNCWAPPLRLGDVSCQPCHTLRFRAGRSLLAKATVSDHDPKQPPNPSQDCTSATP